MYLHIIIQTSFCYNLFVVCFQGVLKMDPTERMTGLECMEHPYFEGLPQRERDRTNYISNSLAASVISPPPTVFSFNIISMLVHYFTILFPIDGVDMYLSFREIVLTQIITPIFQKTFLGHLMYANN